MSTPEGRALREKLRSLEREFKDFDRTLRRSVDEFKIGIDQERKDFCDGLEERENSFFQRVEGHIEHWRRNHQTIFQLLDAEVEAFLKAATTPTTVPK